MKQVAKFVCFGEAESNGLPVSCLNRQTLSFMAERKIPFDLPALVARVDLRDDEVGELENLR
jgi:hypothetical protein